MRIPFGLRRRDADLWNEAQTFADADNDLAQRGRPRVAAAGKRPVQGLLAYARNADQPTFRSLSSRRRYRLARLISFSRDVTAWATQAWQT